MGKRYECCQAHHGNCEIVKLWLQKKWRGAKPGCLENDPPQRASKKYKDGTPHGDGNPSDARSY